MKPLSHIVAACLGAVFVLVIQGSPQSGAQEPAWQVTDNALMRGRATQGTSALSSTGKAATQTALTELGDIPAATMSRVDATVRQGSIRGVVVDDQGVPVAGAKVETWVQHVMMGAVITDNQGHFVMTVPSEGYYTLKAFMGNLSGMCSHYDLKKEARIKIEACRRILARCVDDKGNLVQEKVNISGQKIGNVFTQRWWQGELVGEGELLVPLGRWRLTANGRDGSSRSLQIDAESAGPGEVLTFVLPPHTGVTFKFELGGSLVMADDTIEFEILDSSGQSQCSGNLNMSGPWSYNPDERGVFTFQSTDRPQVKAVFDYQGRSMEVTVDVTRRPARDDSILVRLPTGTKGMPEVVLWIPGDSHCRRARLVEDEGEALLPLSSKLRDVWKQGLAVRIVLISGSDLALVEAPPGIRELTPTFLPAARLRVEGLPVEGVSGYRMHAMRLQQPHFIDYNCCMGEPDIHGMTELGPLIPGLHNVKVYEGNRELSSQDMDLQPGLTTLRFKDLPTLGTLRLTGCQDQENLLYVCGGEVRRALSNKGGTVTLDVAGGSDCPLVVSSLRGVMKVEAPFPEVLKFQPQDCRRLKLLTNLLSSDEQFPFKPGDVLVGCDGVLFGNYAMIQQLFDTEHVSYRVERSGQTVDLEVIKERRWICRDLWQKYGIPE